AGRHPTPDLGHRARFRPPRARMADGGEPRRVDQLDRRHLDRRLPVHGRAALMARDMSTPLKHVRGLGPAKSRTGHLFRPPLPAVANVPLTIAFVLIVIGLL